MADRFWDKLGFQRLQQNQAFMRCPPDVLGVFFQLRVMCGNSDLEDGSIPIGAVKRATVGDVLDYLTDYGDAKSRNAYKKRLDRLVKVGVLTVTGKNDVVKIAHYEAEQGLGRTIDTNRKRADAKLKFQENVKRAADYLATVFKASGAMAMPYDLLHTSIRNRSGCIKRTADALLAAMIDDGVLVCAGESGLYSLASLATPPVAGAGAEFSGRKFPLESEPELESELDRGDKSPQLGAGQLEGRSPPGSGEPCGASPPDAGRGRGERSEERAHWEPDRRGGANVMTCPEDAFSVTDPLLASKIFLQTMPGWCEHSRPNSKEGSTWRILRAKWKEFGEGFTDSERDALWRSQLREIYEDKYDKNWNSFSSIFVSRLVKSAALLSGECSKSLNR